jgi:hypothetical protein
MGRKNVSFRPFEEAAGLLASICRELKEAMNDNEMVRFLDALFSEFALEDS